MSEPSTPPLASLFRPPADRLHFHRALTDQSRRNRRDPTGTKGLRRIFRAQFHRRLATINAAARILLGAPDQHFPAVARNDPLFALVQRLRDPSHHLASFAGQFDQAVAAVLLDGWHLKYLLQAYASGILAAAKLIPGSDPQPKPMPDMYPQQSMRELTDIATSISAQVNRVVQVMVLRKAPPQRKQRAVLATVRKFDTRANAFANVQVVKLHNAGRLAQFQASGFTHVGIIPERLPPKRDSLHDVGRRRDLHRLENDPVEADPEGPTAREIGRAERAYERLQRSEMVEVLTAGDDLVCDECEDISAGGPYEIDEALGLIPAHPNCRCAFVPADDERFAAIEEE